MSLNRYAELTDEQYQLIGKTIIEFSNIHFNIGIIYTRLLMVSDFIGRYVTNKMSAYSIIENIPFGRFC